MEIHNQKEKHECIDVLEFIRNYGALIVVWIVLFTMLGLPQFSLISAFLQTCFLLLWTYYGHWLVHYIPDDSILSRINPHMFIHHNAETSVPRWVNLLQEAVFNSLGFLIILIVQHLLGVHIFSTSIVVGTGLLYVLIHIFDYSIFGNAEHREHHKKARCNYAPDFMDVLAGTRCEPDAPYYNENCEIFHTIVAVSITFLLKNYFNWS